MASPPPPPPPMPRPAMAHSSAFLLPASSSAAAAPAGAYALVVLNQRLPRFAPLLWTRAQVRVCADGGANRVFDGMPELLPGQNPDEVRVRYKPDVIKGDMDSIRPEVKEYYSNLLMLSALGYSPLIAYIVYALIRSLLIPVTLTYLLSSVMQKAIKIMLVFILMYLIASDLQLSHGKKYLELRLHARSFSDLIPSYGISAETIVFYGQLQGTKIVDESHDQDTTDLHKCVSFITENAPVPDKSNLYILVIGALGGRFDHEMGNINVLHLFPNVRIVLLSDDCLIFLLPRTHTHNIHIEQSVEGPHCGLIPIGSPSMSTTTTGLRWNLDNTSMSYGGLISTSNIVEEDKVTVTSDSDLIWTISLRH